MATRSAKAAGTKKSKATKSSSSRTKTSKASRPTAATKTAAQATTKTATKAATKTAAKAATKTAAKAAGTSARSTKAKAAPGATTSSRSARMKEAAHAGARGSVSKSRTRSTDKLARYRSMRDFGRTPEPAGARPGPWKKTGNPYFVIQKHAASRLHYDFRLEVDGVLKSWAVPKGPSMDPQVKRLAVEVEDHPVEYSDFEGIIPKGEYGGGTVIVWDAGPYRNLKRKAGKEVPMAECHERGQVEIWLEGRKVRGGFALVHTRMGEKGRNWLLVKMKDETVTDEDPVAERTESVLSGCTIEEVAGKPRRVWSSR